MSYVGKTELDALLSRVREDRADTTGKNRNTVAYDCWRMFEDLAKRFKEESEMRVRYKRQSDSWRDTAFELKEQLDEALNSLRELFPIAMFSFPKRGHSGPCGPEAGCDAICQDVATLSEILQRARSVIAKATDTCLAGRNEGEQSK